MTIDFSKHPDGLVPAIVQDANTKCVLMLGYMNQEAVTKTQEKRQVTFFSRSKNRLWTKGEESGHVLSLIDIAVDCDRDALLIQAKPKGPTCHKGDDTCWGNSNTPHYGFLSALEEVIADRKNNPSDKSYVASLFAKGINKIAQKVGEEAVETVIEAKDTNSDLFLNESADLLFHMMILLQAKGQSLNDVVRVLEERKKG
ncbi:MAG: bifunctional phosphoribosyl-AMP cyclohydrolase/phosphoribosyl-ATP diphosphatase HisIE [Flavobacteriaceae bacterium]